VSDQDGESGWVDEDGLWWCAQGGAGAIGPGWFHTLVSIMSAADRVEALRRAGFSLDPDGGATESVHARHPTGFWVTGDASLLTTALCYWEDWNPRFAAGPAQHARQQAAFDRAYDAARAVGLAALGEPSLQGRDRDELGHRWSLWRVGEVLVAVHQAVGDVQFGLSVQLDARRHPAGAPLEPRSPFVDWMWSGP
jgi:hypothetical protein